MAHEHFIGFAKVGSFRRPATRVFPILGTSGVAKLPPPAPGATIVGMRFDAQELPRLAAMEEI